MPKSASRGVLGRVARRLKPWTQPVFGWIDALLIPINSVIWVMVYFITMFWADQCRDVVVQLVEYRLMEDKLLDTKPSELAWGLLTTGFLGCLLLFSLAVWYMARIMYTTKVVLFAATLTRKSRIQTHWPRILGGLPPAITFFGIWLSVGNPIAFEGGHPVVVMTLVALVGLAYVWFVVYRRRLAARKFFKRFIEVERKVQNVHGSAKTLKKLGPWPTIWVVGAIALAGLFVHLFRQERFPFWVTGFFANTLLIYLLALTVLTVGTTAISYLSRKTYIPMYVLLLVAAGLFAYFQLSENHVVRVYPDSQWLDPRETLPRLLKDQVFNPAQLPGSASAKKTPKIRQTAGPAINGKESAQEPGIPVVLVSAEGGGIRAAYWTARVLAELHCQGQARSAGATPTGSMVAISGASGGSLGAATFAAWLRHPKAWSSDLTTCRRSANIIKRMLRSDFLTPVFANMLFPDLVQRFLPWQMTVDRAEVMERAWEYQWVRAQAQGSSDDSAKGETASGQFEQPLQKLWDRTDSSVPPGKRVPLLFLNGTEVESGRRLIVTPYRFDSNDFHCWFHNADQAADLMHESVRLSTATLLSARFTYISPAGRLDANGNGSTRTDGSYASPSMAKPCDDGVLLTDNRGWIRIVDGGYFDNSAATTSVEVLKALQSTDIGTRIRPILVQISNDPKPRMAAAKDESGRNEWLVYPEVLSPPYTFETTREARAQTALEESRALALKNRGMFAHFALCKTAVGLPLGWALSVRAQVEMDKQLGPPFDASNADGVSTAAAVRHQDEIKRILEFLENPDTTPDGDAGRVADRCGL